MRFVSKSTNLMLVLKPGYPGNIQLGTPATSGIYVKFQNGVVEVKEPSIIDLMIKHPGYNIDYISAESEDPYEYQRNDSEPSHVLTEIKYGHAEKAVGSRKPTRLSPEIKALLQEEATRMAHAMLPGMMKEVLSQIQNNASSASKEEIATPEVASSQKEEEFDDSEEISDEEEETTNGIEFYEEDPGIVEDKIVKEVVKDISSPKEEEKISEIKDETTSKKGPTRWFKK